MTRALSGFGIATRVRSPARGRFRRRGGRGSGRLGRRSVINAPVAVITPRSALIVDYLGAGAGIARGRHIAQADFMVTVAVISVRSRKVMEVLLASRCAPTRRWPGGFPNSRCYGDSRGRRSGTATGLRRGCATTSTLPAAVSTRRAQRGARLASRQGPFSAGAQRPAHFWRRRQAAAVTSPGRLGACSAYSVHHDAAQSGRGGVAQTLAHEVRLPISGRGAQRLGDKSVDGILAALEPVFDSRRRDPQRVASRALDNLRPWRWRPARRSDRQVRTAETCDAIDVATCWSRRACRAKPDGRAHSREPGSSLGCHRREGGSDLVRS